MEREIIVLANSWRPGGRCVAGICISEDDEWNGKWIRPIYEDKRKQNAVPLKEVEHINLLSIVKINLKPSPPIIKYQRENYYIDDSKKEGNWSQTGIKTLKEVEQFCEADDPILHSKGKYACSDDMSKLSPQEWKSLILVKKSVKFKKENGDWFGSFDDGSLSKLPVKDPIAGEILDNNPTLKHGHYILAISLAEPWSPNNSTPERCYKLIAGIIDFY